MRNIRRWCSDLMKEGKSTGPVQNESRVNYTKLNNQSA